MNRIVLPTLLLSSLFAAGCATVPHETCGYPVPCAEDRASEHAVHYMERLAMAQGGDPQPVTVPTRVIAALPDESPFIADRDIPHQPPAVTPPDPTLVKFDSAAAQASLDAINLATCSAAGAPAGYGHAHVTFASDGHVTKVAVDSPSGMTSSAVTCIGTCLGAATTSAFDGEPITMGATFRVD